MATPIAAGGIRLYVAARRFTLAHNSSVLPTRCLRGRHRRSTRFVMCPVECAEDPSTRRSFHSSAPPRRSVPVPPSFDQDRGVSRDANIEREEDGNKFMDVVEVAVRCHLRRKHGDAFRCSSDHLLALEPSARNRRGGVGDGSGGASAVVNRAGEVVDVLAALNGYERIRPPFLSSSSSSERGGGSVALAEGVVAHPRSGVEEDYRVYARPSAATAENYSRMRGRRRAHPPFVEEDYTVWRLLEKKIDDRLNAWEESARRRWSAYSQRVRRPIELAYEKAYLPVANKVRQLVLASKDGSGEEDKSRRVEALAANLGAESNKEGRSGSFQADEDLIIVSPDGSILVAEDVHPRFRLLLLPRPIPFLPAASSSPDSSGSLGIALRRSSSPAPLPPPYHLGHRRAGTVLSASLVLFGAAPMTYRSLLHALDYPALASVVAFSVAGTVSYGMWSGRSGARTRGAESVAEAALSRASARDGAALEALREGAVRAAAEGAARAYLDRLGGSPKRGGGCRGESKLEGERDTEDEEEELPRCCWGPDPEELAMELGLLRRSDSQGESADDGVLEAVSFSDARLHLLKAV